MVCRDQYSDHVNLLRLLKSLHILLSFCFPQLIGFCFPSFSSHHPLPHVHGQGQPLIHLMLQVNVTTHLSLITSITSISDAHFLLCNYTIAFSFCSSAESSLYMLPYSSHSRFGLHSYVYITTLTCQQDFHGVLAVCKEASSQYGMLVWEETSPQSLQAFFYAAMVLVILAILIQWVYLQGPIITSQCLLIRKHFSPSSLPSSINSSAFCGVPKALSGDVAQNLH